MTMLTLAEAIEQDRLEEFAAQAEADGVGPANRQEFDRLMGEVAKAPPPEDQTSH